MDVGLLRRTAGRPPQVRRVVQEEAVEHPYPPRESFDRRSLSLIHHHRIHRIQELPTLEDLERKLSYEDIRFYRSIARSQLRKDLAARKKLEEERQKQQAQTRGGWTSWLWGSSPSSEPAPAEESTFTGEMTDEQRKQLYEVLDYDEKTALAEAFQAPRDALKVRVVATLDKGSFALKTDPHGKNAEILSVVCDSVQSTFVQRPDNFEVSLSVGGLAVKDGTTTNTLYPLIVHVQEAQSASPTYHTQDGEPLVGPVDPFFFLKFENNPLDERADSALTVRMRYMEIVYHRGYVEAVYKFFKPPSSQLESVEALLVGGVFLALSQGIQVES